MIPLTELNNTNTNLQPSEIININRVLESEFNKISTIIENNGVKLECKRIVAELFSIFICGICFSEFYEKSMGPMMTSFLVMGFLAVSIAEGTYNVIQLKKHLVPLDKVKTDFNYEFFKNNPEIPDSYTVILEDRTDKIKAEKIIAQKKAIQPLVEKAYAIVRSMLLKEITKENNIPPEITKLICTQLSELK